MNQKIENLKKQCYISIIDRDGDIEYDMEKFAELIIKEHLSIWHQMDNGNKVEGYVEMEDYPRAILKYFGIK